MWASIPPRTICTTSSQTYHLCTWSKHFLSAVINNCSPPPSSPLSPGILATSLTTCSSLLTFLPSPHFLLPCSQRSVLTVRCHPSGLSSVAPGRLARTAWDSAHFPALIIPACSAGTGLCHSGLRRPPLPPPPLRLPFLTSPLSSCISSPFSQGNYCTPPFLPDLVTSPLSFSYTV